MPRFEQIHASHRKRRSEDSDISTRQDYQPVTSGGGSPDVDELLEKIDAVLSEVTVRELGRSTGIESD